MKHLKARVGEYVKDGSTKGRYVTIGVLMDGENGQYILMDPAFNPAGAYVLQRVMNPQKAGDRLMVSVFEPYDESKSSKPQAKGFDDMNDDIPF